MKNGNSQFKLIVMPLAKRSIVSQDLEPTSAFIASMSRAVYGVLGTIPCSTNICEAIKLLGGASMFPTEHSLKASMRNINLILAGPWRTSIVWPILASNIIQHSPPVIDSNFAATPDHAVEIPFRSANYRIHINKDLIILLDFPCLLISASLAVTSNLHNGVLPFDRGTWWTRVRSWLQR